MNSQYELARVIHAERLARGIAEREADQLARQHPSPRPIRRAIGRSMVRIGIRLAEPNLPPGPVTLSDRAGRPHPFLRTLP